MRARPALATACLALLAGGCSGPPVDAASAQSAAASGVVAAAQAAAEPTTKLRLRGNAVLGKDGYGIVPCGETAQRIFSVDTPALPFLDKFLEGGAREFFLDGWTEAQADGRPRVTAFERLYTEGPGCDEALAQVAFAARGTEPFWALVQGEDGLQLERPDEAPLLASTSWRKESGAHIAEAQTPAGKLELRLQPGICSDGMSDTQYAWAATARLGELQLQGCAFAGLAPLPR